MGARSAGEDAVGLAGEDVVVDLELIDEHMA